VQLRELQATVQDLRAELVALRASLDATRKVA
jgi:hypothetical protein